MFGKKPQKVNKNGLHLDLLVMLKQHMHGSLYASARSKDGSQRHNSSHLLIIITYDMH